MEDKNWNPVEPYGKSCGGHTYDVVEKSNVFMIHKSIRRVLWEKQLDVCYVKPDDTQNRRDKRRFHNRIRKAAEDNA